MVKLSAIVFSQLIFSSNPQVDILRQTGVEHPGILVVRDYIYIYHIYIIMYDYF